METKLKYLEFIQAAIARMSQNSFKLKGWTITLVSALSALGASGQDHRFVIVSYVAIPTFWILDGFFVATERRFREIYSVAVADESTNPTFAMDPTVYSDVHPWSKGIFSKTLLVFYPVLILLTLVVMFALG